jgi:lipoprotein-anchoring transpeptidase ErfK/SrfK
MRRTALLVGSLFLLALFLAVPSTAVAASCSLHNDVYVCDARPTQPTFTVPGYAAGSLFFSRTYAWMDDYAPFFDAPGGSPVDQASEGLLYYTIEETVADGSGNTWYRVDDRWASAANMHLYEESKFAGVEVNTRPERPFGWVLQRVRAAPAPDAAPAADTPWVEKYTFVEIYDATSGADGWIWYDIGNGRWIKQTYLGLVDVSPRPSGVDEGDFWVEVDLYEQTVAAYEGNRLVYATVVSTGLPGWDTNEGLFTVYARHEEWHMWGGEVGDDYYYLQDVPHTMFFDDEIALHGAYWHDEFGYKRSHGCVNMPPRTAEWVWNWSEDAPNEDLWVWVHTSDQTDILSQFELSAGVASVDDWNR